MVFDKRWHDMGHPFQDVAEISQWKKNSKRYASRLKGFCKWLEFTAIPYTKVKNPHQNLQVPNKKTVGIWACLARSSSAPSVGDAGRVCQIMRIPWWILWRSTESSFDRDLSIGLLSSLYNWVGSHPPFKANNQAQMAFGVFYHLDNFYWQMANQRKHSRYFFWWIILLDVKKVYSKLTVMKHETTLNHHEFHLHKLAKSFKNTSWWNGIILYNFQVILQAHLKYPPKKCHEMPRWQPEKMGQHFGNLMASQPTLPKGKPLVNKPY